jgi:predicted transposase/invertase (TIGR01784 family)
MKRDPLFFRLFKELPCCFFHLVGRTAADAGRYQLEAIEYKSTAVRLDGLFRPLQSSDGPAYLWEAQFHSSDTVYANMMSKIARFLEHDDPAQDWIAVVIYPTRDLEQKCLRPYRCLIESDQLVRIFPNELPPAAPDHFELGILELIAAKPEAALAKAREMVPRLRDARVATQSQRAPLQLIETVIVHQFPNWSRAEIEKMLQVTDVTQTRVYQEGVEQGREEGRQEGLQEGVQVGIETVARRLLESGQPIAEIARATGLTAAQIRKLSKNKQK